MITRNFVLHTKFCALAFSYKADYIRGSSCTFFYEQAKFACPLPKIQKTLISAPGNLNS